MGYEERNTPLEKQTTEDLTTIREDFFKQSNLLDKIIVFGHTWTQLLGAEEGRVWIQRDKIGIDTGAGHRQRLTLFDITSEREYTKDVGAGMKRS